MKSGFYDYCVYPNVRWELFSISSSEKWVVAYNCTQSWRWSEGVVLHLGKPSNCCWFN